MRNLLSITILSVGLSASMSLAQGTAPAATPAVNPPKANLAIVARLKKDLKGRYSLKCYLDHPPCVIRGDFDGDRKTDKAGLVMYLGNSKKGIAIIHGNGTAAALGPGSPLAGEPNDDYSTWIKAWKLFRRAKIPKGLNPVQPPVLKGDALLIERKDGTSGIIYWNGESYAWYDFK